MTYDFSLDRKAAIVLSAGSVVLVLLVFFAGFLTGMSWRPEPQLGAVRRAPVTKADAIAPPKPETVKSGATKDTVPTGPVTSNPSPQAPQADKSPPADTAPAPAPAPPPAPAGGSAAPPGDQNGVRLAVLVGSFLDKANAEKLVEHLKDAGYSPQIVPGSSANKHWNVVRVGPYQDWDEANQIATLLSRDQGSPAVIRPMR